MSQWGREEGGKGGSDWGTEAGRERARERSSEQVQFFLKHEDTYTRYITQSGTFDYNIISTVRIWRWFKYFIALDYKQRTTSDTRPIYHLNNNCIRAEYFIHTYVVFNDERLTHRKLRKWSLNDDGDSLVVISFGQDMNVHISEIYEFDPESVRYCCHTVQYNSD